MCNPNLVYGQFPNLVYGDPGHFLNLVYDPVSIPSGPQGGHFPNLASIHFIHSTITSYNLLIAAAVEEEEEDHHHLCQGFPEEPNQMDY